MHCSVAIIGAGIIGSATAYALSKRGVSGIHVYDTDLEGALSSTERNAGGVRHLWQQPVNIELARHSLNLFHEISDEIGFQKTGYLWLYNEASAAQGKDQLKITGSHGLEYDELSVTEIQNRYPFLDKTSDLAFGIYGRRDGLINSNALKLFYRNEAKKRGAIFHDKSFVTGVTEGKEGVHLKVGHIRGEKEATAQLENPAHPFKETFGVGADRVIIAAGAWSGPLLSPYLKDTKITPVRRQIVVFKADGFDMTPYGMVVDTSRVYFHPEGGNILAGFVIKDEKPGFKFNLDQDFLESHVWPALHERSTHFERLKAVTGWGGLYSYTPDTSGIIGIVPGTQNIFECHSFTGRGVMQSYGAAIAVSELVTTGKFTTINAKSLGRDRFETGKLLPEGLHI